MRLIELLMKYMGVEQYSATTLSPLIQLKKLEEVNKSKEEKRLNDLKIQLKKRARNRKNKKYLKRKKALKESSSPKLQFKQPSNYINYLQNEQHILEMVTDPFYEEDSFSKNWYRPDIPGPHWNGLGVNSFNEIEIEDISIYEMDTDINNNNW